MIHMVSVFTVVGACWVLKLPETVGILQLYTGTVPYMVLCSSFYSHF